MKDWIIKPNIRNINIQEYLNNEDKWKPNTMAIHDLENDNE